MSTAKHINMALQLSSEIFFGFKVYQSLSLLASYLDDMNLALEVIVIFCQNSLLSPCDPFAWNDRSLKTSNVGREYIACLQ